MRNGGYCKLRKTSSDPNENKFEVISKSQPEEAGNEYHGEIYKVLFVGDISSCKDYLDMRESSWML